MCDAPWSGLALCNVASVLISSLKEVMRNRKEFELVEAHAKLLGLAAWVTVAVATLSKVSNTAYYLIAYPHQKQVSALSVSGSDLECVPVSG